jgi:predicted RNA-binding protein YlqC (UPF0109 family)
MRELLEFVTRSLVDDPAAVELRESQSQAQPAVVFQLRVATNDIGRVIGKHGRTAHALRLLLAAAAARDNRRAVLEIQE